MHKIEKTPQRIVSDQRYACALDESDGALRMAGFNSSRTEEMGYRKAGPAAKTFTGVIFNVASSYYKILGIPLSIIPKWNNARSR